jgi:hypothetical protein
MIVAALSLLLAVAPAPDGAGPPREDPARADAIPAAPPAPVAVPASSAEGLGSGPAAADLLPRPRLGAPPDRAWIEGRVLLGASAGTGVGDLAVISLAYGTYRLFTSGAVSATAPHFRAAGVGLAAAILVLPPLGAALGGGWAGPGVRAGGFWRAFLLAALGNALAITAGYLTAPTFWALVPVQLALMAPATSLAFRWGAPTRSGPAPSAAAPPPAPAAAQTGTVALGAPGCPIGG